MPLASIFSACFRTNSTYKEYADASPQGPGAPANASSAPGDQGPLKTSGADDAQTVERLSKPGSNQDRISSRHKQVPAAAAAASAVDPAGAATSDTAPIAAPDAGEGTLERPLLLKAALAPSLFTLAAGTPIAEEASEDGYEAPSQPQSPPHLPLYAPSPRVPSFHPHGPHPSRLSRVATGQKSEISEAGDGPSSQPASAPVSTGLPPAGVHPKSQRSETLPTSKGPNSNSTFWDVTGVRSDDPLLHWTSSMSHSQQLIVYLPEVVPGSDGMSISEPSSTPCQSSYQASKLASGNMSNRGSPNSNATSAQHNAVSYNPSNTGDGLPVPLALGGIGLRASGGSRQHGERERDRERDQHHHHMQTQPHHHMPHTGTFSMERRKSWRSDPMLLKLLAARNSAGHPVPTPGSSRRPSNSNGNSNSLTLMKSKRRRKSMSMGQLLVCAPTSSNSPRPSGSQISSGTRSQPQTQTPTPTHTVSTSSMSGFSAAQHSSHQRTSPGGTSMGGTSMNGISMNGSSGPFSVTTTTMRPRMVDASVQTMAEVAFVGVTGGGGGGGAHAPPFASMPQGLHQQGSSHLLHPLFIPGFPMRPPSVSNNAGHSLMSVAEAGQSSSALHPLAADDILASASALLMGHLLGNRGSVHSTFTPSLRDWGEHLGSNSQSSLHRMLSNSENPSGSLSLQLMGGARESAGPRSTPTLRTGLLTGTHLHQQLLVRGGNSGSLGGGSKPGSAVRIGGLNTDSPAGSSSQHELQRRLYLQHGQQYSVQLHEQQLGGGGGGGSVSAAVGMSYLVLAALARSTTQQPPGSPRSP